MRNKKPDPFFEIFESAPKLPKVYPHSKNKKKRKYVQLGEELDQLLAFRILENFIRTKGVEIYKRVKEKVLTNFAEAAHELKRRPESFFGVGSKTKATCELRKRASYFGIAENLLETLDAYGISYKSTVAVPETLALNTEQDQETLEYLAKVLKNDLKLRNKKIVVKNPKVMIHSVTDCTLDDMATKLSPKEFKFHFDIWDVATFAIGRFSYNGKSIKFDKSKVERKSIDLSFKILKNINRKQREK